MLFVSIFLSLNTQRLTHNSIDIFLSCSERVCLLLIVSLSFHPSLCNLHLFIVFAITMLLLCVCGGVSSIDFCFVSYYHHLIIIITMIKIFSIQKNAFFCCCFYFQFIISSIVCIYCLLWVYEWVCLCVCFGSYLFSLMLLLFSFSFSFLSLSFCFFMRNS